MEVHDFDQEHLVSILKDDDDNQEDVSDGTREAAKHPRAVARCPRAASGDEHNTSKERYALLPDYAQENFVRSSGETSDPSPLSFQDSRQDVEQHLPKHIKTVGTVQRC